MSSERRSDAGRSLWDSCAGSYEERIVSGHPDILSLESFEEDLIDAMLRFLINRGSPPIALMDIGCGSGRLHLRYLVKTARELRVPGSDALQETVNRMRSASSLAYDPIIAKGLSEIWGIDYSSEMLKLAKEKMAAAAYLDHPLECTLVEGSAYELEPAGRDTLPISVCLINTIGIVSEPERVFVAMRRQVEKAGGIACIFCYKKDAVLSHALGNYESTLDVSGQPTWLLPRDYAGTGFTMVAKNYKLAHSEDPHLVVDVFGRDHELVRKDFALTRDPDAVSRTLQSGHIQTLSGYESHWYGYDQLESWIEEFWSGNGRTYHVDAQTLDRVRAEPEQIATFDPENRLDGFMSWGD